MRETTLLTGGTGMVGRGLAALLLQRTSSDVLLLIHRNGQHLDKSDLVRRILGLPADEEYVSRLTILHGDITQTNLGLTTAEQEDLSRRLTHVLHAAASTRFDLPLEQARRINVGGSENVARLALRSPGLQQFGLLSTVYVSGTRTGRVEEAAPGQGTAFINSYEQSKCEAEIALWRLVPGLPLAVYRLSTVVGDSRNGHVTHFTAPHQALRIMHLGLGALVPGKPECPVDFISSDYSASTVFELFWENFACHQTYHITHGDGSLSLQEAVEENYRGLARADEEWARRRYPMPAIVTPAAFDLFMETALTARNLAMTSTLRALDRFARQFVHPKEFDRANVLAALPAYESRLPDVHDYYPKMIEYCVRTRWGRGQPLE